MNVELLEKIAETIASRPNHFDISSWHNSYGVCGTTHCIGGWAQVLSGIRASTDHEEMAKLLGLKHAYDAMYEDSLNDDCEAARLFVVDYWAEPFLSRYRDAVDDPSERAKVACDYIHHFIETEGK